MRTPLVMAVSAALLGVALPGTALAVPPPTDPEVAGAAAADPHTSQPLTSAEAAPGGSRIRWQRCARSYLRLSGARCAMVPVPLDHDNAGGESIRIAIARVKHTSSERDYLGPMLVNPGGPGGSGLTYATLGDELPNRVAGRYDWIGFDPRGVGASRPALTCDDTYFRFGRPDYYPRPEANERAWLRRSKHYARACADNGTILDHMTTVDNARDMEALRVALGEDRINFYGFSYGTYLGQVYSTLFPDRVGRQVLDSNVNPKRVFYRANLDQDVAFQKVFEKWFGWIARNNDSYGLGSSRAAVRRAYWDAHRALGRADGRFGPNEWIDVLLPAGYARFVWPTMAELFADYVNDGRIKPLIREYRHSGDFGDDNSFAVYSAVQCTDAPWPRDWSVWERDNWAIYDRARVMTWANAWFNAPCLYWPAPSRARFAVDGSRAPDTLLIGGTLDGATPFQGSVAVRRLFPGSRLIAIKGESTHAASLSGNRCVDRRVVAYLSTGDLPKRRSGNRADVTCQPVRDPRP